MNDTLAAFINTMKHPLKFRLFLLGNLPSAYFSGVRLKNIDEKSCSVTVPYKWFSRNPFRSTYFACLAMAGEMSTGALAMMHIYKRKPSISMLVVNMQMEYGKKATGRTTFICEDGERFATAIEEAVQTGEPKLIKARSIGRNEAGETVAELFITWSFKIKNQQKI